jgi:hypothetical protein
MVRSMVTDSDNSNSLFMFDLLKPALAERGVLGTNLESSELTHETRAPHELGRQYGPSSTFCQCE